jgi:Fe-S cluster biosynthesis and repair protein YggX
MRAKEIFIMYVRTKQVFSLRYRGVNDEIQPVHISTQEIEKRFFPYPKFNREKEVEKLVLDGELIVNKENRSFQYSVTKGGKIDLSLLKVKPLPDDNIYQTMLTSIKNVSLPAGAQSTSYFDLFLKYQKSRPELFFKVDSFAGRVHTPISNFHRTHRPYILLEGEETSSLDVATMQPLLLGKIIFQNIGENEYSNWLNEGKDIYLELMQKSNLKEREQAKKKFFEILFSKPSKALSKMFGESDWINWVNTFKTLDITDNPHNVEKPHSNLGRN